MWGWRKMEKFGWKNRERNEKVWYESKRRGISYTQQEQKKRGNWFGHILRSNFPLKYIFEEKKEENSNGRKDEEENVDS